MKITTLLLTVLIISLTGGTALADRHHSQRHKVDCYQGNLVNNTRWGWQQTNYRPQQHRSQREWAQKTPYEKRRTRIARIIRKQRHHQQRRYAAQHNRYNHQEHYRSVRHQTQYIIIPLSPITRIAFFFPW